MRKFLTLIFISLSISGYSQITWEKLFAYPHHDVFRSVIEVPSGGFAAAGYTSRFSSNDSDAYVVRLNSAGDTIWTYTYNGPLSKGDLFYKIINTNDNGFVLCGYTASNSGLSDDILVVKLNASGEQQFVKFFGGSGKDRAQDILQTSDDKFTLVGYTTTTSNYYDAVMMRLSSSGDSLWKKEYGGTGYDDANSVQVLFDGGYILGGQSSNGANGLDQYLIRTNSAGDVLWTKHNGTLLSDNIECIRKISNGFIMAGSTNTVSSGDDGYLVKTDTAGNVIWARSYGNDEQNDFHSVNEVSNGGFIMCGTTTNQIATDSIPSIWLVRTNSSGDTTWTKTFGGANHDHGYNAIEADDGGFIAAGFSSSFCFNWDDAYLIKTNSSGNVTNPLRYIIADSLYSPTCSGSASIVKVGLRNCGNESVSNITVTVTMTGGISQTLNGNLAGPFEPGDVTTFTLSPSVNTSGAGSITFSLATNADNDVIPANSSSVRTVSLSPCVGIEDVEVELGYGFYPNPSSSNLIIEFSKNYSKARIELMNGAGETINSLVLTNTAGKKETIDVSSYASGIYFIKVNTNEGFSVGKIMIAR